MIQIIDFPDQARLSEISLTEIVSTITLLLRSTKILLLRVIVQYFFECNCLDFNLYEYD